MKLRFWPTSKGMSAFAASERHGRTYWFALWTALTLLMVFVAMGVILLLRSHQAAEEQQRVDDAARDVASSIHRALSRSLQDVGGLAGVTKDPIAWRRTATAALNESRALLRVELRDSSMELRDARDSPYEPPLFLNVPRYKSDSEAVKACESATGPALPAFSRSYFVSLGAGRGVEVLDVCSSLQINDETVGFSVATIGLASLLEATMTEDMKKVFEASFVEGSNTRLARAGSSPGMATFRAERVIALPGLLLRLRLESTKDSPPLLLNFASGAAIAALLLFVILVAFIVRELRARQRRRDDAAALARVNQDRLQSAARLALVGEVTSLISHEINQPLTSILACAKAAKNVAGDNLSVELRQILDQLAAEAERSGLVVRSVRDFASRSYVKRETVDMRELIEGIRPILQGLARDYKAKLEETKESAATIRVICDRMMIEQVILNLVKNGLQAMQANPGHKSRTVSLSTRMVREGKVQVDISDTGPGVSLQLVHSLAQPEFKSFQRISGKGLGLGLSLCRAVLHSHKGSISCHNRIDSDDGHGGTTEGATFSFLLPVSDPHFTQPSCENSNV